jgi:diacylglycerol kinase family enzyme
MRYVFVFNPAAQHGRAARQRPALDAALRAEGVSYSIVETEAPGHGVRLAREAAREAAVVVAVGGDGTIHEVARGVCGTGAAMGVLPLGTGNDFAHAVGMPDDLGEALRALLAAEPQPVDVGHVRWRAGAGGEAVEREALFANCLGVGFDALAAREARRYKGLGGKGAYLAAVFQTLWTWKQPPVEVLLSQEGIAEDIVAGAGEVVGTASAAPAPALAESPPVPRPPSTAPFGLTDGEAERLHGGRFFLVEVGNGFSVGGGFLLTPDAVVDDGLLDVCLIERASRARVLRLLPTAFTGAHVGEPEVTMRRARRVTIRSAAPLPFHADGEILSAGATALDVAVLAGALRVLAPHVRRP